MEIKAKKERLHYVDVSKGLLALMVVLSHLQNVGECKINCVRL